MIAAPFAPSRLPVGSSAKRIFGWGAAARARATLCCSPLLLDAGFNPSGSRVFTLSHREGVTVYDLDGNDLLRLETGVPAYSAAWSPDGLRIAAGLEDGTVRVWEAKELP